MRILGAGLLVISFLLAGCGSLRDRRARILCLRQICDALALIRGELSCHAAPFSDIVKVLERHAEGAGCGLTKALKEGLGTLGEQAFSEIWRQAVAESCAVLSEEDRQELDRLGPVLGRYEISAQLRALDVCLEFLRGRAVEAARCLPAQRRLQLGLALSSGAILAILLL